MRKFIENYYFNLNVHKLIIFSKPMFANFINEIYPKVCPIHFGLSTGIIVDFDDTGVIDYIADIYGRTTNILFL